MIKFKINKFASPAKERRRVERSSTRDVFSYYASSSKPSKSTTPTRRSVSDQSNAYALKSNYRFRLGHLPSYIAILAITVAVLYTCILDPSPRVVIYSKSGTISRENNVYQENVGDIWKSSILNRTKLTVSTYKIRRTIETQFHELSEVRVELPLIGHRPAIFLTPQAPILQLISNNGSFYIDIDGKVLARTSDVKQNELKDIPIIRDETGLLAEVGKNILTSREVLFLKKLSAQHVAEKINVDTITMPSRAANEADVRVKGEKYYIKYSFDMDPRQGVGTYLAAKARLDAERKSITEYIDVRVDEKVFYK